jgi:hypothetical protein
MQNPTGYSSIPQFGQHRTAQLQIDGEDVTDKDLQKRGAKARGKIRGTNGKSETLDPSKHRFS